MNLSSPSRRLAGLLMLVSAAAATLVAGRAAAWSSSLYPELPGSLPLRHQRAIVDYAGRQWQLPDFSYAGYQLGSKAPGSDIACSAGNSLRIGTSGDISAALQAAIDRLGASGGGTVLIPAGRYQISRTIAVPYSGVSILGAGSGRTVIEVPASYRPLDEEDEGLFTLGTAVGRNHHYWLSDGRVIGRVTVPVAEGSRQLTVADPAGLVPGQWLLIQQYHWAALSARNDSSGTWRHYDDAVFPPAGSPDRRFSFSYLRRITAIRGHDLEVDAPIPIALDPANNVIGLRSVDQRPSGSVITPRDNLGITGLSIAFADNANGSNGFPVGIGVHMEGVRNGWIYDVKVHNFPRFGFVIDSSARVSITDSAAIRAQNTAGHGRGYGFLSIDSQNLLLRNNYAELTRHGYLNQSGLNSVIAYTRNESAGVRMNGDDMHHGLAHQLLWDRHVLNHGSGLLLTYRGSASSNAQESNRSSVIWNLSGNGYRGTHNGGFVSLNPAADGYAIMVGGSRLLPVFDDGETPASGSPMLGYPGLQVGPPADVARPGTRDRNVLYDGLHQSGLSPASLWDQQIIERLGAIPKAFASSTCAPLPVRGPVPRATWTGPGELVFNGDQLGWASAFGSACPGNMENGDFSTAAATCKVNAQTVNQTPGGRYALALLPTAKLNGVIVSLGGPQVATSSYSRLQFSVYPSAATFSFSLSLVDRPFAAGAPAPSLGTVNVGNLLPNRWNSVSLPISRFAAGRFNTVVLKSLGTSSAAPVWIDDVSLQ